MMKVQFSKQIGVLQGGAKAVLLLILFVSSCAQDGGKGRLIAKVGDKELYAEDIRFLNYNAADSAEIVSNYVANWAEEQILVRVAEDNDELDLKSIDRKVEQFRNELLIYQLENKEIEAALDTVVSQQEIEAYYKAHKDDFQLNDYLVKVLYLKVPLDAPEPEKIRNAYQLNKQGDLKTVEVYAKMYASNFYYDIESWIYFDDLLKEIPLHDINKDKFILKRSKTRFEDDGYYYFLNIVDYKLKNSISPLSFERENIKVRILNLRITKLREEIKNGHVKKAYEEGKVELY